MNLRSLEIFKGVEYCSENRVEIELGLRWLLERGIEEFSIFGVM